jgi:D-3-phosphoglycerate dehydrogenase
MRIAVSRHAVWLFGLLIADDAIRVQMARLAAWNDRVLRSERQPGGPFCAAGTTRFRRDVAARGNEPPPPHPTTQEGSGTLTSFTTPLIPVAPRIAVDLDGVLTEYPAPLAQAANRHFGLDLPDRAFIDSAGLNVPLEVREWVYDDNGPAAALKSAAGARDFLARVLHLFGAENVLIITARPERSAAMTKAWLEAHGFPVCKVVFADDKMSVARVQGCAYAVEDSERHARNYAAGGITCFLLGSALTAEELDDPTIVPVESFEQIVAHLIAGEPGAVPRATLRQMLPPVESGVTERPRIVVSDAIHPVARAELSEHGELVDVDGTDLPALLASLHDADALVVRSETQVTEEVIAAGPRLKVIARAGVGVDNIDLDAATRAGVLVLNAPGANATSAGEHTIALLLSLTRQIPFANQSTREGHWARKKVKPIDLRGRTVGIVGLGRVGTVVAKRLQAFEMNVIAYDPYIPAARFEELGVTPVAYDELLRSADVVTFHVPSTSETRNMLNAESMRLLKPSAIVLNAARGDVVDQVALCAALEAGAIAGACVDVFPHEPCTESPLFAFPNVVVTPHTGGSSAEALEAVGRVIASSTLAALRGEAVANAVNMPAATVETAQLRRLTSVASAAGHLLSVLTPELPAQIQLTVRGMVPDDVTEHVLGAALSEALQRWLGRRVTPVNAQMVAEEVGLAVSHVSGDRDEDVLPQFVFGARGATSHGVTIQWDRANAGIVEIDRFSLDKPLSGHVLITHHHDQPGVIGQLGTVLGRHGVNIAGMQVGRHAPRGEALMVTNVDERITPEALEEIKSCTAVEDAFVVTLPEFEAEGEPSAFAPLGVAAVGQR